MNNMNPAKTSSEKGALQNLIDKVFQLKNQKRNSLALAIDWVKRNRVEGSGILVHHLSGDVTPEVTGYLIASLDNAG